MGFYGDDIHTIRYDHLVVNKLEGLIMSKGGVHEVEAIPNEEQQVEEQNVLEVVISATHHQCEFLGYFSLHSRIMGLLCVE